MSTGPTALRPEPEPGTAAADRTGRVTVVVAFSGGRAEADALLAALDALRLAPGDRILVVDTSKPRSLLAALPEGRVQMRPGGTEPMSWQPHNLAAEGAETEWLLFLDPDCRPSPGLIERYFEPPIPDGCGVVVGDVVTDAAGRSAVARYEAQRRPSGQARRFNHPFRPFGSTANLLVRRAAWEAVGGFLEGVRAGADAEFCWRVQDAGWSVLWRGEAVAERTSLPSVRALAAEAVREGRGHAWVDRRFRGAFPRPRPVGDVASALGAAAVSMARGHWEHARFGGLDAIRRAAASLGYLLDVRVAPPTGVPFSQTAQAPLAFSLLADVFPALSETFISNEVRELAAAGHAVRVEATARPSRPERAATRALPAAYIEDDGILDKLSSLLWLASRHPVRCLGDLRDRRRWRREEEVWPLRTLAPMARRVRRAGSRHLHVHFAMTAALNTLRVARLLGMPWSLAAHGYDIFRDPCNLRLKLEEAAFTVTACDYNVRHLVPLLPPSRADRVHKLITGVDGRLWQRGRPYPGGRTVLAIGRLVEKKGFVHLIEAAARLAEGGEPARVVIVGDGPLRATLQAQVDERRLQGWVNLLGWLEPQEVRRLMEQADLLAMPCVVAADGDRDSMPLVVKEALALEIPVVVSDEVGLPELVRPEFGRLVPPGDAQALAEAIADLLALPTQAREAMGRAGRRAVLAECSLRAETAKLCRLIEEVAAPRRAPGPTA